MCRAGWGMTRQTVWDRSEAGRETRPKMGCAWVVPSLMSWLLKPFWVEPTCNKLRGLLSRWTSMGPDQVWTDMDRPGLYMLGRHGLGRTVLNRCACQIIKIMPIDFSRWLSSWPQQHTMPMSYYLTLDLNAHWFDGRPVMSRWKHEWITLATPLPF